MKGTLIGSLSELVARRPRDPAIRAKRLGVWQPISYRELWERSLALAAGLAELGLARGQVLGILGRNAPEWILAELAAQALGALPMGLYADALGDEVRDLLIHAGAAGVIVADEEQLDKIEPIQERFRFVLVWEEAGLSHRLEGRVRAFREAVEAGRGGVDAIASGLEARNPDEIALLAPTSGTTGRPKLAMLRHRNLIAGHRALAQALGFRGDEWLFSYLPLAWIGEQMLTVVHLLVTGGTVHFPEEPATLEADRREVQPDLYLASARQWEEAAALIQSRAEEADALKRAVYRIGLSTLLKGAERELQNEPVPPLLDLARALFEPLVARPLRARMGLSACRMAVTGGAPLGPQVFTFFRAIGLDIRQVYGQSETAAATAAHRTGAIVPETVGPPLPGTEVRIADDGEIQVRGPQVFAGYYRNERATREAFTEDGWFRTGDAGTIDPHGHLIVLGRLKEVGQLADGTPFASPTIENRLKFSPYIREAVVLGQDRPYVAALLELDPENAQRWARGQGLAFPTYQALAQSPEIYALLSAEVARANAGLPPPLRVRRIAVLPKELHPDDAEVTRTRKVRRRVVEERYAPLIEALYRGEDRARLTLAIRYEEREGTIEAEVRIADVVSDRQEAVRDV